MTPTEVNGSFVRQVYRRLSHVYDLAFGPVLQPGRRRAVAVMDVQPGARVLEVGVGTGLTLPLYPPSCEVTGIDYSPSMLERARVRAAQGGRQPHLFEMDAARLGFKDNSFDVVYAPYVLSVVPDPVQVLREMWRVCRHAGRLIVLNHFRSRDPRWSRLEAWLTPRTVHLGFKADLSLEELQRAVNLKPQLIEGVNWPRIWTLAVFRKERR